MKEQVKLSVFYPYPPEKVWQVLTDSRILNSWMMKNDFEPRLGHKFKFESKSLPGIKTSIRCEVIELEQPKRLAYTWQDEITSEPSLVIWTLTPVEGGTQLQLRHQQTGYATVIMSEPNRDFSDRPGLFLYQQPVSNCDRQMSRSSLQLATVDELNSLLDRRSSREEWDYRLNHKLPQVFKSHC